MRIKAAFLDFDGTLGEMRPSHFAAYRSAAAEVGIEVSEEALASRDLDDAWARWMTPDGAVHLAESASEAAFREVRIALAVDRLRAAGAQADEATLRRAGERVAEVEGDPSWYVLYDDALPALERLARAGVEAVVISNHVWRLPEIVRALGAGAKFEGVVTSARVGARKPHPRIFEQALRLTSARPEESVMVGDSLSADVAGGERVGMHGVYLDRRGRPAPDGVVTIRSLLDIPLEWPPS
ncbi:MAG: HAD family hydrolase [Dehalococcoidia bacterium]|nr:MAG: HAD family hydrolase [Dehalococcoidia bacterium]